MFPYLECNAIMFFNLSKRLLACFIIITMVGCNENSTVNEPDKKNSVPKAPKLSFHRPKTLTAAVDRIKELHTAVLEKKALPAPSEIKYVEVIHGEGDSAHSHYYMASKFYSAEKGELDTHEGEDIKETVEDRVMKLDCITELFDLARWLPSIAAATDLDEEAWNNIKKNSETLKTLIEPHLKEKNEAEFCKAWIAKSEEVEKVLTMLREISKEEKKD